MTIRRILFMVAVIATVVTTTCGGSSSPTAPTATTSSTRTVTSLSVSASAMSLEVGQTTTVTATAAYSDGTSATVAATWSSSNTGVATVSTSGTVTAVAAGSATITGTYEGQSGSVGITATVTVTSTSTYTLSGQVTEHLQGPLSDVTITVLSGDYTGRSTTTDSIGHFAFTDVAGNLNFSVTKPGYGEQRFGANPSAAIHTVTMYRLFTLAGTVRSHLNDPLEGVTITVFDGGFAGWVTNTNTDGYYEMKNVWGNFNISFTKDGYLEQRFGVNNNARSVDLVLSPPLSRVDVDAAITVLALGKTTTVTATAHYADGSEQQVSAAWVSSNPAVASVTANGTVLGLTVGSVVVTGTYDGKSGSVEIDVREITLSSVSVNISDGSLTIGETATMTATAQYSDGSSQQVTPSWASSHAGVASVTAGGTVTALSVGTAVITGTYEGKSGTVSVDVREDKQTVNVWVGAWLQGGWVNNATVRIGDAASATTNAEGKATLELSEFGTLSIVVEASGFHRSESEIYVSQSGASFGQRNIIPDDHNWFDLNFHDHVFRDKGARGTQRWASRPTVEIWTTKFECIAVNGKYCDRYQATSESAPASHESRVRSVFANDVAGITNGELSGLSIQTKSHAVGTVIENDVCGQARDTIVATYIDMEMNGAQAYAPTCLYLSSGEFYASQIVMKTGSAIGAYRHEVAHTLGWNHPDGYCNNVPRDSIMRGSCETSITQWDKNHGKILYIRPPGSRSPDKDPTGYNVNLLTPRGVLPRPGTAPSGQGWSLQQNRPLFRGPLIEIIEH